MKSIKLAILYGFLVWAVPFVVAMLIFPLRSNERPLFESIMPVVVTISAVLFSVFYFKKVGQHHFREGILLGIIFLAINVALDLALFSKGPMAMPIIDYLKDIGLTYLLIPAVTMGFGYVLEKTTIQQQKPGENKKERKK